MGCVPWCGTLALVRTTLPRGSGDGDQKCRTWRGLLRRLPSPNNAWRSRRGSGRWRSLTDAALKRMPGARRLRSPVRSLWPRAIHSMHREGCQRISFPHSEQVWARQRTRLELKSGSSRSAFLAAWISSLVGGTRRAPRGGLSSGLGIVIRASTSAAASSSRSLFRLRRLSYWSALAPRCRSGAGLPSQPVSARARTGYPSLSGRSS